MHVLNIYHFCKCLACNPDFQSCRAMLVPKCIRVLAGLPFSSQMQSYADALLYQNDGEMGAVKQEAGSSSAEAGQANQEPTCSASQEGNLCRPTAPTAPPTSMPPVIATQQQVEAR